MILEIKYINDLTFKYVHDLIMDNEGCEIEFIEIDDGVNPEVLFTICNLLQYYGQDKFSKIKFTTYRNFLPIDELSPDLFFRGIPFDELDLNGKLHYINTNKL